jgi:hypothetical protein
MCYLLKGSRSTYRVKESERAGGVELQSVRVADFAGVFGLGIVALEGDGDGQSCGLVADELGNLRRLLGLLRCGRGRRSLAGSLLRGLDGSGCNFGLNLSLLP